MANGGKISCSDLKKLQIKRRRNKVERGEYLENLPLSSLNAALSRSENDQNVTFKNPFIKLQCNELNNCEILIEKSDESFKSQSNFSFKESDYIINPKIQNDSSINPQTEDAKCDLSDFYVEKSLKTSIIIESDRSLTHWQTKIGNPSYLLQSMKDPGNENIIVYYRYPDMSLPVHQKKNIHKALSNSSIKLNNRDENFDWYRMFSEKWRKALLSAFETLKHGCIQMFYFVLENLTVLFERDSIDGTLKAYMQLTSPALAEDFKKNDIEFKIISEVKPLDESKSLSADNLALSAEQVSETDDNADFEQIIPVIPTKRAKSIFKKEDIMIEGALSVAELVDFLINQKDRNSFAILPEIFSPGPFIHGTLRSNIISFSGPCKGTENEMIFQLKVNGIAFPNCINSFIKELKASGHKISLTVERDGNTDFLSSYTYI